MCFESFDPCSPSRVNANGMNASSVLLIMVNRSTSGRYLIGSFQDSPLVLLWGVVRKTISHAMVSVEATVPI